MDQGKARRVRERSAEFEEGLCQEFAEALQAKGEYDKDVAHYRYSMGILNRELANATDAGPEPKRDATHPNHSANIIGRELAKAHNALRESERNIARIKQLLNIPNDRRLERMTAKEISRLSAAQLKVIGSQAVEAMAQSLVDKKTTGAEASPPKGV